MAALLDEAIRIDFLVALPPELGVKVLTYLDSRALCRAAQVSRAWRRMADDDMVWHRLCEQHIEKRCATCGWGLPLLEKRRLWDRRHEADGDPKTETDSRKGRKRRWKEVYAERYRIEANWRSGRHRTLEFRHPNHASVRSIQFDEQFLITGTVDGSIYVWDVETSELVRKLAGHTRSVNTLKFDSTYVVSGSADNTVRMWDYRTGTCVCVFRGHTDDVLSLDFDSTSPSTSLGMTSSRQPIPVLLGSGSKDSTIRIWNFLSRTCFALRGHTDSVTSVKLHTGSNTLYSCSEDLSVRVWDLSSKRCVSVVSAAGAKDAHVAQITCLQLLFVDDSNDITTSDDNDNNNNYNNNTGDEEEQAQEQGVDEEQDREQNGEQEENQDQDQEEYGAAPGEAGAEHDAEQIMFTSTMDPSDAFVMPPLESINHRTFDQVHFGNRPTHLVTASLDSTIKVWSLFSSSSSSGSNSNSNSQSRFRPRCLRTLFGHREGIWSLSTTTTTFPSHSYATTPATPFRLASAAHDHLVKIWDWQTGQCWHTFAGHTDSVGCVCLSETRVASGGDEGVVRMLCFDEIEEEEVRNRGG